MMSKSWVFMLSWTRRERHRTVSLLVNLADHLFNVQMGCDIHATPLPAHVSVKLEPISGAPSDNEMIKVQDAIRSYQRFDTVPSMFDPRVSMELFQHSFDLQMARHMRLAGESQPRSATDVHMVNVSQSTPAIDIHEQMEQSNQLNERFNQVLERLTQILERQTNIQVIQPLKRSNELAERANAFAEQLNWLTDRSNELSEETKKPVERFEGLMKNINRVLVGIQHAIVRNRRDNKPSALDCLVNEKGETLSSSKTTHRKGYDWLSKYESSRPNLSVMIGSVSQDIYVPEGWLAEFVCFYGIWQGVCESETSTELMEGKGKEARERLSRYLSSCLG
ncbi:hypothetical protein B0J17DRAFT_667582 [Rhizoctonia solani]|nr:hypothetical protein B0J17DRAFT_667582 [Rhizoctonia solani]